MLVRMKTTKRESPDDITTYIYQQGISYDVPMKLGRKMVEKDWAVELDPNTGSPRTAEPSFAQDSKDRKVSKGPKEHK